MLHDNGVFGILCAVIFGLAIFSNGGFILYLIINKVKTSVDKLFLNLAVLELFVVALGIPFVVDVWIGTPYKYGNMGCQGMVPLHHIIDFGEAFLFCLLVAFVAEKLKGDTLIQKQTIVFICLLYFASICILIPLFGVNKLSTSLERNLGNDVYPVNEEKKPFCVEDWNIKASYILRAMRVVFQLIFPIAICSIYHRKSFRIIKCIRNSIDTKNMRAKYQSFSKVVAETVDQSEPQYLKFTQSEEMNLEMGHIYQRENSISSVQRDEETLKVSVQVFTNEITIEKITSYSPLWKGTKPDTKWKRENEYQKLVLSIKWYKYTKNLFTVSLIASVLFILCILPNSIMILYSFNVAPLYYNSTERLAAKVCFCLRLIPSVVNPWLFMFGVVKYRKNICGKCCKR